MLSELNFISMINKNTRVHNNTGNCIDHIFLKASVPGFDQKCCSMVLETHITDHRATILGLPIEAIQPHGSSALREIEYINYKGLSRDLENYDWTTYFSKNDVNVLVNQLTHIIKTATAKNTIIKELKKCQIKRNPWISSGIVNSVNKKNQLYSEYMHPEKEQKRWNKLIRRAKFRFYKEQIHKNRNTPKNLWNLVNKIWMNKPKQLLKEVVAPNNTLCNTPLSIANTFNDYFVSIGKSYAASQRRRNRFNY
nr:unnamed protein product [Callosobruchus analis]